MCTHRATQTIISRYKGFKNSAASYHHVQVVSALLITNLCAEKMGNPMGTPVRRAAWA